MSDRTSIGWTDATWNPWHGCTKVSPGCAHCYMFRDKTRYGQNPELVVRSKTTFNDPLKWREPKRVFTCSWSDWFHEAADAWRAEAWDIIRRTPHLTYQILTKRPERIQGNLPWGMYGDPWPNVWLGTSVENQRFAYRARVISTIPAAVRFVSAEPLLGPVSLPLGGIHWVIAGGESGPDCRPMREEWARSLRDQCAEYGVAFFLKQLGGHPDARAHDKALLDGSTHTEFPEVAT
jgi:protein gp37